MGLIKSQQAPPSLAAFSMKDVEDQARALLIGSRRKAEQLLLAAQQEAEKLKEQAALDGFEEGRQAGLEEGRRQGADAGKQQAQADHAQAMQQAVAALNEAMGQLDASSQLLETEALQDVIELSIAIARRVTKRQGLLDPQVMVENLRDAMRLVLHAADVRIAVNPAQRATLDEALPALQMEFPQLAHVAVIEDATIDAGGCRVHTRGGKIDADLDVQLDRIVSDLLPSPDEGGVTQ